MKLSTTTTLLTILLVGTVASAQTANTTSPKRGQRIVIIEQTPACQNILTACKKAGFIAGEMKEDNGLYKDCFNPLLHGLTPTQRGQNVTVQINPADAQTCYAALSAARKGK